MLKAVGGVAGRVHVPATEGDIEASLCTVPVGSSSALPVGRRVYGPILSGAEPRTACLWAEVWFSRDSGLTPGSSDHMPRGSPVASFWRSEW